MGIGVYESSQYVAGIGGHLTIDSEPGQGTRVRVRLPLSDGERQDKAAATNRGRRRSITFYDGNSQTTTHCRGRPRATETDALGVRSLRDRSRQRPRVGHRADCAEANPRWLRWIWAFLPTRTILRKGLRLLEEIHALAPDTKVIVLTGQNDRANALKAIGLGAYDFCTKPFEPELSDMDHRTSISRP